MNDIIIKINKKKIVIFLFMFLILFYPFNSTVTNLFYKNNVILIASILLSMVGLCILGKNKISKKELLIIFYLLVVLCLVIVNNYYLTNLRGITFILYLFLPFVIVRNEYSIDSFCLAIKIFIIEHFTFNLIAIFFKNFYKNNILYLVCRGRSYCAAGGNFYRGYIPGFTSHFSTNAIYISIATLFLFSEFLATKKRKYFVLTVLSIFLLFATGKRLHLIATLLCLFVSYFCDFSKKANKKIIKKIIMVLLSVIVVGLILYKLSNYIPELMNFFVRVANQISSDDVLNGRFEMIQMAISLWNRHLLFGNGWGFFSYNYRFFGATGTTRTMYMDAHNVYVQLLCEVGLIGFLVILSLLLFIFYKSFKNLYMKNLSSNEKIISKFSFSYFLFFLIYCFTGNPLYDPQCYVVLFIVIGFVLYLYFKGANENEKV